MDRVQVYFSPITASIGYIRAGKLRGLGVTSATRSEALPDIPTIAEVVSGYEASGWYGLVAPKGTPPEVIGALNRRTNDILADNQAKETLITLGATVFAGSPAILASSFPTKSISGPKLSKSRGSSRNKLAVVHWTSHNRSVKHGA